MTAARWADAAREQDRLWPFLEAFLAGQGPENSGYVTEEFLADVATAAGVDVGAAAVHAASEDAATALDRATAAARRTGVRGTPTFAIGERIVPVDRLFEALGR